MPALSFKHIWHLEFSSQLIAPAIAPIIVLLGSFLFFQLFNSILQLDQETKGLFILAGGLCNTSFIGFPLIKSYFGEKYVSIAIISDQMTFLLFASIALLIAGYYSGAKTIQLKTLPKQLIQFPPFIATCIALILPSSIGFPPIENCFSILGATVAPLALFSIGLQLKFANWRNEMGKMAPVFVFKLMIAPALVFLFVFIGKFKAEFAQVAVFESAMPVLMSLSILCERFQLKPQLANLLIGFSILFGFISTFIWQHLLIQFL